MKFNLKLIFLSFIFIIILVRDNIAFHKDLKQPSEVECKPFIVKALKEFENPDCLSTEDTLKQKNENEEENKIDLLNETQKKFDNKIKLTVRHSKQDNEINDKKSKNGTTVINSITTNDKSNSNINYDNRRFMEDSAKELIGNENDVDNKEKNSRRTINSNVNSMNNDHTGETEQYKKSIVKDKIVDKQVKDLSGNRDEHKDDIEDDTNKDNREIETNQEIDDDHEKENQYEFADNPVQEVRSRAHINEILHLNDDNTNSNEMEMKTKKINNIILRDLKKLYENSIKPLETVYKYRDLSNRYFGDAEIYSKPLIIFMGPWSGGKSTIINYLLQDEYDNVLKTGAEPSPAVFHILMWSNETEILDGTQLAADSIFSGLQKFGQGLEEKLKGYKINNKLLKKINIVEIPGILELSKVVTRSYSFNDVCQWFIDRADLIYLVYDPMKIDVGPEIAAILNQLKGRESQIRILFNKADQLSHDEILKLQNTLIWNISPVMSSAQPPIIYITSLWSRAYTNFNLAALLKEQELELLNDLQNTIEKKIENKIANARRFAIRVRNHAKMVDCYLTTYYNHKTMFGNRKVISDAIIKNPQHYHIYEGLSTLTNISRYDLPDPDSYRVFFHLNSLFEFRKLSDTCTYFKGCPINKLDIAIAYDLPELASKYKKSIQQIKSSTHN